MCVKGVHLSVADRTHPFRLYGGTYPPLPFAQWSAESIILDIGDSIAPKCSDKLFNVMSRYVMLCHVLLCYVMLFYVTLCYVMLFYVMLC